MGVSGGQALEELEAVLWRRLPAGLPGAADLVDAVLAAAEAHAESAVLADRARTAAANARPVLTSRQLQVATLLARGLRYADVAEQLGLSEGTVDRHAQNACRRIGATGKGGLVRWVRQLDAAAETEAA